MAPFNAPAAATAIRAGGGEGEIVNIASTAGIAAMGSSIPYCASKAALLNMTVALARVLAPKIRVQRRRAGFHRWPLVAQRAGCFVRDRAQDL